MTNYRILGVIEADDAGSALALGGPKQRCLLAVLLNAAGRVVPTDVVIDALWGDGPPAKASVSLRAYTSNLRQILHAGTRLESKSYGYRLTPAADDTIDVEVFEAAVARGRAALAAGRSADAATALTEALRLWRGLPFGEFGDLTVFRPTVDRTNALRDNAIEARFDALLQSGQAVDVIGDLEAAVAESPLQERLWGHLMVALHRAGRTGDALACYDRVRTVLDAELGTGPGEGLRRIFAQINRPQAAPVLPPTVAPRGPSPFVGRDAQRADLDAAAAGALTGSGGLMLLTGASGIGKTQLAQSLWDRRPDGLDAVWASHPAHAGVPALWTWIQVIRDAGAYHDCAVRTHICHRYPGAVAALVPEWLSGTTQPPAASGFALADGVVGILRTLAATRPLLIVLDDLHAADAESLDVVQLLKPQLHRLSILVVATWTMYGPDRPVEPEHLAALRMSNSTSIPLHGLDHDETAALLRSFGASASAQTVERLRAHTGGNPFFLREVVRSVGADLTANRTLSVSDAAIDVVGARLRRLDDSVGDLLVIAAVIGPQFDVTALADVADLPVTAVHRLLRSAYDAGIIDEIPSAPAAFTFCHAIMCDAVLAAASTVDRMRAHSRAAQRHPQTISPVAYEAAIATADHAWRAGSELDAEVALELHENAINTALHRSAYADIETTTRHALQVCARIPRKPEMLDRQATLWLHLAGANAIRHGHGSTEFLDAIGHAVEIGEFSSGRNYFGAIAAQCQVMCGQGRIAEARAIVDALAGQESVASSDAGLALLFCRVMVEGLAGDYRGALAAGEDLLARYPVPDTVTDPLHFFHPRVHCFAAAAHANLGEVAEARESCRRALEVARSRGDVFNILAAQVTTVEVDAMVGMRPTTIDEAAAVAHALIAAGAPQWAACAQMVEAWARCLAVDAALDTAAAAAEAYDTYVFDGSSAMTPYFLVLRADIEARCGRIASAEALLHQAESVAQSTGEHAWDPMISARRAQVASTPDTPSRR
ncbi:AAA family ATPase [Gordonia sp. TBRC 11910]|uniref:AAA family ATPase n=1 Tax=Gordonia asplenii TaxID=2725283 RepID=A0A848KWK0_9ACTN|nr:AfsR/SARP family transcriptional regulator [Gordonia asplenii]NMO01245.1 AAA family ATPase [Gordonia asplenii]